MELNETVGVGEARKMSWQLHIDCCSTAELDKNEVYGLAVDAALHARVQ